MALPAAGLVERELMGGALPAPPAARGAVRPGDEHGAGAARGAAVEREGLDVGQPVAGERAQACADLGHDRVDLARGDLVLLAGERKGRPGGREYPSTPPRGARGRRALSVHVRAGDVLLEPVRGLDDEPERPLEAVDRALVERHRVTEHRRPLDGDHPADDRLRREPRAARRARASSTLQIGDAICAHGSPSVPATLRTTTSCVRSPVVGRLNQSSPSAWRITS